MLCDSHNGVCAHTPDKVDCYAPAVIWSNTRLRLMGGRIGAKKVMVCRLMVRFGGIGRVVFESLSAGPTTDGI